MKADYVPIFFYSKYTSGHVVGYPFHNYFKCLLKIDVFISSLIFDATRKHVLAEF